MSTLLSELVRPFQFVWYMHVFCCRFPLCLSIICPFDSYWLTWTVLSLRLSGRSLLSILLIAIFESPVQNRRIICVNFSFTGLTRHLGFVIGSFVTSLCALCLSWFSYPRECLCLSRLIGRRLIYVYSYLGLCRVSLLRPRVPLSVRLSPTGPGSLLWSSPRPTLEVTRLPFHLRGGLLSERCYSYFYKSVFSVDSIN